LEVMKKKPIILQKKIAEAKAKIKKWKKLRRAIEMELKKMSKMGKRREAKVLVKKKRVWNKAKKVKLLEKKNANYKIVPAKAQKKDEKRK